MLTELTPYIRHALQLGAGFLVSRGIIDASLVESFVGVGLSLVTFAWAFFARRTPPQTTP